MVDAVVVVGGMASVVAVAIAGAIRHAGRDRPEEEQDSGEVGELAGTAGAARASSDVLVGTRRWHTAAVAGAAACIAVRGRNWRGVGFRVVGLRRVDALTDRSVSVRSALAGVAFDQAQQRTVKLLAGSPARRARSPASELGPRLREIEREHAGDREARDRAVMDLYTSNEVNPFAGFKKQVAISLVMRLVLALGSRKGRTVRDRATGTCVIIDG